MTFQAAMQSSKIVRRRCHIIASFDRGTWRELKCTFFLYCRERRNSDRRSVGKLARKLTEIKNVKIFFFYFIVDCELN